MTRKVAIAPTQEKQVSLLEDVKPDAKKVESLSRKLKRLDNDSMKLAEIILNNRKPYHEKLKYIKNEIEESVRDVEFMYKIPGFFEDTCYALHRSVQALQGYTKMQNNKTASADNPPTMIDVRFADGKRIKVPFGKINLPSFGKNSFINMQFDNGKKVLHVSGICQKKYTTLMDDIMEDTIRIVNTESIYKNKAIKYDGVNSPEFMDLSKIDETALFLTDEAKYATEPIEVRITNPDVCIQAGLDLKFGVLLEGNYGTGKTLYAGKLALKAIANGWTFIYCSNPAEALGALKVANKFTKNGTGVVLFVEDIDQILNKRAETTNEISLLMDGSETKHNNLISIFSTNHIENIDPTFLRGKRIGSIVTLEHLDALTAEKMIHHYLGDTLKGSCTKAGQEVENAKIVPAFLQEIIDRVKTGSILREGQQVTESDILNSIKQFKRQMTIATVKVNNETEEQTITRLQGNIHKKLVRDGLKTNGVINALDGFLRDQDYDTNDL